MNSKKNIISTLVKFFVLLFCLVFGVSGAVRADLYKKKNKNNLVYWHDQESSKKNTLTFDDGPSSNATPEILDILNKHNVKATFFVLGEYVELNPAIAKRIHDDGHVIGNHTYNHPDLRFVFNHAIKNQIEKAEKAIVFATGERTLLFRPPYGGYNSRLARIVKELGYFCIEYSVSASDGGKKIDSAKITKNVLERTKNGAIILIHDGDRYVKNAMREQTIQALPVIIKKLKEKGFVLVTIEELLDLNLERG